MASEETPAGASDGFSAPVRWLCHAGLLLAALWLIFGGGLAER